MADARVSTSTSDTTFPILVRDQTFACYTTHAARVTYVRPPQEDISGLVSPSARRQSQERQVAHRRALAIERRGRQAATRRRVCLLQRYPVGVLGVDGPANDARDSVYRHVHTRVGAQTQVHEAFRQQRQAYLASRSLSLAEKRHTRTSSASSASMDTFHRLNLESTTTRRPVTTISVRAFDQARAQHLRNHEQAGRPYNIVNGSPVVYCPPTVPEKHVPRQAHPSLSIHGYMTR